MNKKKQSEKSKKPHEVFTLREFCEVHRMSPALYHKLALKGMGPKIMKVGRRRFVDKAAAAEWRQRMMGDV